MKDLLLNYVKYNFWANTRLTDKLKSISPEAWDKEQKSSFKTIRLTLLHIYDAETIWYERLNGTSLSKMPSDGFTDTNETAIGLLLEGSKKFIHFMNGQSEETLQSLCNFKSLEGTEYSTMVSDIILHCMNHSTFHRGQIIMMLRNCDIDVLPSTDYITYIRLNVK